MLDSKPEASSAHMVVNMASLPSTVTVVSAGACAREATAGARILRGGCGCGCGGGSGGARGGAWPGIGRAAWRGRGEISGGGGSFKKKKREEEGSTPSSS